jgi:hypothetical protein
LAQFIFIIAEPSSSGAISATIRVKQQGTSDTVLAPSGTLSGSSINMTDTNSQNLPVISGTFDYSQKRFTGTFTAKCAPNIATTGTYNFTAIKQ